MNGISKNNDSLLLVCPEGYVEIEDDNSNSYNLPVVEIETRVIGGEKYMTLKPAGDTRWLMFGGNFGYCSDSRFRRMSAYPLAIHDRCEG
jgi:hypothetical protein